jgi:hypothetical protein
MLNSRTAADRQPSDRTSAGLIVRLLASICVALALIALTLAVLYGRQSERLRCAEDRAEMGLIGRSNICP